MVFDPEQLQNHIAAYLVAVQKQFRVEQAILFGSYAQGTQREDSDVDLIVISPDFRGTPKLQRHQELGWIAWKAETDYLEPLGFTPEEYENASPLGLLGEVKETGIVVYETEPALAVRETPTPYQPGGATPIMKREDNPQEWLRYAENDRRAATHLVEGKFYEASVFHCQQAVEKLLKAIIVYQTKQRPVHTHDLNALLEKITAAPFTEDIAHAVSDIDSYYVSSRYPMDVADPGYFIQPLAQSAVQRMNEVFQWFLTRVNFVNE